MLFASAAFLAVEAERNCSSNSSAHNLVAGLTLEQLDGAPAVRRLVIALAHGLVTEASVAAVEALLCPAVVQFQLIRLSGDLSKKM